MSRNLAAGLLVAVLHVGVIYVLYNGLLTRAVELVVPVTVLAQLIEPPKPREMLPAPAPPAPLQIRKAIAKSTAAPVPAPALAPVAIADKKPAVNAPTGVAVLQIAPQLTPQPSPAPIAAPPVAVAAAPPSPPSPASVQLPSSNADYLQNPLPPFPPISRRLNEEGTSMLRVLIGVDGVPQRAEVTKSSGYERLDSAALATAMRWRYVPGKRGGVAETMWVSVPIVWVLN